MRNMPGGVLQKDFSEPADGAQRMIFFYRDRQGEPGSGSPLFYINTWAMVWPNDYPAVAT